MTDRERILKMINERLERIQKDIDLLEKQETIRTLQTQEETYLLQCKASQCELRVLRTEIEHLI